MNDWIMVENKPIIQHIAIQALVAFAKAGKKEVRYL